MAFKGMNKKAAEAKAKSQAKKTEDKIKSAKAADDAAWSITDKKEVSELKKKQEIQEKAERERVRKEENKKLLEEEEIAMASINTKKPQGLPKLSKAQIQAQLLIKNMARNYNAEATSDQGIDPSQAQQAQATYKIDYDTTNYNKEAQRRADEAVQEGQDYLVAQDLSEALQLFEEEDKDVHPEKRRKAAFEAYCQDEMLRIKEEKPNLRMNQYKNLLFKEFQTSMRNPVYAAKQRQNTMR